jgi:hypothetical protein
VRGGFTGAAWRGEDDSQVQRSFLRARMGATTAPYAVSRVRASVREMAELRRGGEGEMSPLRFRYHTEICYYVHLNGRVEEWTVLRVTHRPPQKLGEPTREPWPIWEPE